MGSASSTGGARAPAEYGGHWASGPFAFAMRPGYQASLAGRCPRLFTLLTVQHLLLTLIRTYCSL